MSWWRQVGGVRVDLLPLTARGGEVALRSLGIVGAEFCTDTRRCQFGVRTRLVLE